MGSTRVTNLIRIKLKQLKMLSRSSEFSNIPQGDIGKYKKETENYTMNKQRKPKYVSSCNLFREICSKIV